MPEMTSYAPGTPSWTDLGSPDPDASARFYGSLFGWETFSPGDPEQTGGYRMFTLRGKLVAGLGPLQGEGQPPAWTTYISTDDADAVAARASGAGGTVFMGPMDVFEAGRMAIIADPTGAVFGLWQPGQHTGAQVVNEPGSLAWNELGTRDMDAAKRFYREVFGWEGETSSMGPMEYTEWKLDGRTIGGGLVLGEDVPAAVPPHWASYFAVDDCDATVARAGELGGATVVEPMSIPAGRFAHLRDPQGANVAVIALANAT
jgi:predicted enzyme related to lactoylglutathione lyase